MLFLFFYQNFRYSKTSKLSQKKFNPDFFLATSAIFTAGPVCVLQASFRPGIKICQIQALTVRVSCSGGTILTPGEGTACLGEGVLAGPVTPGPGQVRITTIYLVKTFNIQADFGQVLRGAIYALQAYCHTGHMYIHTDNGHYVGKCFIQKISPNFYNT